MVALFEKKKKDEVEAKVPKTAKVQADTKPQETATDVSVPKTVKNVDHGEDIARVLKHPRITEKATLHTDKGMYVFDVVTDATKKQIKEAVYAVYKVHPRKVCVTTIVRKKVRNMRTGIRGVKSGGKKAYIYLKKGDSISLM